LRSENGPADGGLPASRRRWHGDPSVLIMKYSAAAVHESGNDAVDGSSTGA
jgi:hypothetical protein